MAGSRTPPDVAAWRNAVFVVFAVAGAGFATWASRIPAARDELDLGTAEVALLLTGISAGSIVGLVLAPVLIHRTSGRRGLAGCTVGFCVGLLGAAVGAQVVGSVAVTCAALVVFGVCFSATDVLMNVEGAEAEKALGYTALPLMHAFFSIGTILGAVGGAAAIALGAGLVPHFVAATAALAAAVLLAARWLPDHVRVSVAEEREVAPAPSSRRRLQVPERLRDVRLVVIGLMVTGMALTEGAANDWIALAAIDGHAFTEGGGARVFGAFVVGMTVARIAGGPLLDRYGRMPMLLATAGLGLVGLVLFIHAPDTPAVVYAAAVLWGIGGSLGFPIGMSAAADHPTDGPRRVSIIGIFGYGSFLLGPPVIGFVAEHVGLLRSFYLVVALLVVSMVASRATSERAVSSPAPPRTG